MKKIEDPFKLITDHGGSVNLRYCEIDNQLGHPFWDPAFVDCRTLLEDNILHEVESAIKKN